MTISQSIKKEFAKISIKYKCTKCSAEEGDYPHRPFVPSGVTPMKLCPACAKLWLGLSKELAEYRKDKMLLFLGDNGSEKN
uniref:Uncharacterized protein n=1 Tax=viral metagenome TaxID=1070528 RepID=A0A6M3L5B5_9ZZZZ